MPLTNWWHTMKIILLLILCKKDFENDNLSYCELCGRLQRNRQGCYCSLLKDGKFRTFSTEEGTSQTIESHLAKKTLKRD